MSTQEWDWNEFLAKEEHSEGEWKQAAALAGGWPTCACGQLCKLLPRFGVAGAPKDQLTRAIGIYFMEAVKRRDIRQARIQFDLIESRTAELLKEMTK